MWVLQICSRVPFPIKDGGAAAIWSIHTGLKNAGIDATLFAVNTLKHFVEDELIEKQPVIKAVTIDTSVKPLGAFLNLFKTTSYNVDRFYSKQAAITLIELLSNNTYDIIQLESVFVSGYLPIIKKYSSAKIILRSHNIEHEIIEQQSYKEFNFLKRKYLSYLSKKLRKLEIKLAPQYDGIMAISKKEVEFYSKYISSKKIIHVPFGITIPTRIEFNTNQKIKFYFIGALDWQPNIEGVVWLIDKVWKPHFLNTDSVELHIAGKKCPDFLLKMATGNITVHGEIKDTDVFITDKHIMLCPLFSGSGMRIKLVEALAFSKPIIATHIAAEGIDLEKNKCGWLAETQQQFVEKINYCIANKQELNILSNNAYNYANSEFNKDVLNKKIISFYSEI